MPPEKKRKVPIRKYVSFAIVLAFGALLLLGGYQVKVDDECVKVETLLFSAVTVNYGDVDSVRLIDDLIYGERDSGVGSLNTRGGVYINDAYGSYYLYSRNDAEQWVEVSFSGGRTLVFSGRDADDTNTLYSELMQKLN